MEAASTATPSNGPQLRSMPSAQSLLPKPRLAAAPEQIDLVEARQLAHITGLDAAYVEGYTVMREAAGQDISANNLLADSYGPYVAARTALLEAAAVDQDDRLRETSKFVPRNRFLLGAGPVTDVMAPSSACAPLGTNASTGVMGGSYMSWRRQLLAYRFEKRRAGLTDELVKRLAAEAMQRALDAESAEKESFDYAQKAAGDARHAALRHEPLVWRCAQHYESALGREDEVLLSLHMGGRSPTRHHRGRSAAQNLSATQMWGQQQPQAGSTLRGAGGGLGSTGLLSDIDGSGAGLGLPGGRTISSIAFAPKGTDCFAVASGAGVVFLCSAATGEKWATLTGHGGPIIAMDWSPPESRELHLLTVSADRTARIWAVTLPKIVQQQPAAAKPAPSAPAAPVSTPPTSGRGGPSGSSHAAAAADQTAADGGGSSYAALGSPPSSPTRAPSGSGSGSSGSGSAATPTGASAHLRRGASQTPAARGRAAGGTPGPIRGSASMPPLDRSVELQRTRARMMDEQESERTRSEAARGPRLQGGGAYCARIVQLDGALEVGASYYAASHSDSAGVITHAAWCPSLPSLFVLAVAEEADLRLEAAAAEAEAATMASRRGSFADPGAAGDGLDAAADRYDDDITAPVGGGPGAGGGKPFAQLKKGLGDAGRAMRQAGKATMSAIEGGVGGVAKLTEALAKAAGAGDFVQAGGAAGGGPGGGGAGSGGAGGGGPARERRGAILVVDARTGRVVQTRQLKGSKVALTLPGVSGLARGAAGPVILQQSLGYATALTFSASGHQLYVADGRGLLHEYQIETDAGDAQAKPLKSHAVIFGEGGNSFAPLTPDTGNWAGYGGFDAAAAAGIFGLAGAGAGGAHPIPHLTSLFFRPYDAALRSPVLIGLDSQRHARALVLPVQTSAGDYRPPPSATEAGRIAAGAAAMKVANAAKAGARLAVGAMEVVAKGAAAAAVVSAAAATGMNLNINMGGMSLGGNVPQAEEVDFLHYVATSSAAGDAYGSPYGGLGSTGGGMGSSSALRPAALFGASATGGLSTGLGVHTRGPSGGGSGGAPPHGHTSMLPCRLNDGLVVGTAGGDVLVCDPHAEASANRTLGRSVGLGGLAVGGVTRENIPTGVSGVIPAQVVARLSGGHAPGRRIVHVAMNRDESVLVSCDDAGSIAAWRKVPLSVAAAAEAEAAPARGLLSPVGMVTSSRLAALFDAHGGVRSVGKVAADEARQLALGHIGGTGAAAVVGAASAGLSTGGGGSIGSRTGYAFGIASAQGSIGGGAGGSRRALPPSWTAAGSGATGSGAPGGGAPRPVSLAPPPHPR